MTLFIAIMLDLKYGSKETLFEVSFIPHNVSLCCNFRGVKRGRMGRYAWGADLGIFLHPFEPPIRAQKVDRSLPTCLSCQGPSDELKDGAFNTDAERSEQSRGMGIMSKV